jgi:adenylate kinase family enzyme
MRILVLGASGVGTSTLGAAIATSLGWLWIDLDDYYWEETEPPFTTKRDRATRLALVTRELASADDVVVSGSPLDWGASIEDVFDMIVFVTLETATRLQRLHARELKRYGVVNEAFLAWAARYDDDAFDGRSRRSHEAWLTRRRNVLRIDGMLTTDEQVSEVRRMIGR